MGNAETRARIQDKPMPGAHELAGMIATRDETRARGRAAKRVHRLPADITGYQVEVTTRL
jgi:hypothetical protein